MKRVRLEDYPESELSRLAMRCGELKRRLVSFACVRYADDVADAVRQSTDEIRAIDDFIYGTRLSNGQSLIERFVDEEGGLSTEDAELVLGWQQAFYGVFRLEDARGIAVQAMNLVDDLEYTLLATQDTPEIRRVFAENGSFILSRIAPAGELWVLSGGQPLIAKEGRRLAYGLAARLASSHPALFFRNPRHQELGRAQDRKQHERFLEKLGACWVVGPPEVVERHWGELLLEGVPEDRTARTKDVLKARELPRALREAETIGMISDPDEGLYFLREFGRFLSALHAPELARTRDVREVVFGYLDGEGCSPAIFPLVSRLCPVELDAMMAVLLDRPGFSWFRDGEAILWDWNPAFLETPRYPSTIPLGKDLVDGLRFIDDLEASKEPGAYEPLRGRIPSRRHAKKAKAKKTGKRGRGGRSRS